MKVLYFDLETTGLSPVENDIIQMAGIIEINGKEVEKFNFKMQPKHWDNISEQALETHGVTIAQMKQFDHPELIYTKIVAMFDKYIDKFDKNDKFIVAGYNVNFDINFLKEFFSKNGNNFLFSYFGMQKDPYPVINYLRGLGKIDTPNAKLTTMCEYYGIDLDNAHDALGDIKATMEVIKRLDKELS